MKMYCVIKVLAVHVHLSKFWRDTCQLVEIL